ncbi:uncharacterized protein LOC134190182 [Corticium candelabrum]|uniref:uncharacterized protein LOC134190182 n=1 Tax=Corticium candelabrum TaxID=121492 RepID=UPI002E2673F8|nr:uncharacterized protein LOC134190182 [Corticium candelabrum]
MMSTVSYELIPDDGSDEAQEVTLVAVESRNEDERLPPSYDEERVMLDDMRDQYKDEELVVMKYDGAKGTFLEFFITLWVMFLLSLPGYVLVLLHASTAAARGGALCGLGGSIIVYTYLAVSEGMLEATWLALWLHVLGVLFMIQGFLIYHRAKQHASAGKRSPLATEVSDD